ncbi:trypsin-like peptidase domain-containing protein [Pseudonocardia sp. GCM10023141]|uniref:trypsin-like peptidase domain-containing protein n=1 Tax=Pseudonocardia sp. GCM10023141 TaxID=3252653 RepID=UPI00361FF1E9
MAPKPTTSPARRITAGLATGVAVVAMTLAGTGTASAQTAQPPPPTVSPQQASPQNATPTERAAAQVRPAIVYVTESFSAFVSDETGTFFNNGSPYQLSATCTGFGVNPAGYIATAGHCVDITSPDGIRLAFVTAAAKQVAPLIALPLADIVEFGLANWSVEGKAKGSPIDSTITVVSGSTAPGSKGQALPARVVDFRPFTQGDVALLKVEATDLPTVSLASDADVRIGTPLLSVGYPASADAVTDPSLEPSNKDGQVSSRKTVGGVPVYETSAALTPGMSGGPTVDLTGRVLGVNSFMPAGESQAFNFIAPATGLSELLTRNGVRNEAGPDDTLYRGALDSYYAGRYSEAIAGFDRLLQVAPQHAQAAQLRAEAAKARERFGDPVPPPAPGSGLPLGLSPLVFWSIAGGGGALLIGLAVLLVVLRRRRSVPAVLVDNAGLAHNAVPQQRPGAVPMWDPAGPQGGYWQPSAPPAAAIDRFAATVVMARPAVQSCPRCATLLDATAATCRTCGLDR